MLCKGELLINWGTLSEKYQIHKDNVNAIFYKRENDSGFCLRDLILRWDAIKEEKGKYGKFDNL